MSVADIGQVRNTPELRAIVELLPSRKKSELLRVRDFVADGRFTGMHSGPTLTKRRAQELEHIGLLVSAYMEKADDDGFLVEGAASRLAWHPSDLGLRVAAIIDRAEGAQ